MILYIYEALFSNNKICGSQSQTHLLKYIGRHTGAFDGIIWHSEKYRANPALSFENNNQSCFGIFLVWPTVWVCLMVVTVTFCFYEVHPTLTFCKGGWQWRCRWWRPRPGPVPPPRSDRRLRRGAEGLNLEQLLDLCRGWPRTFSENKYKHS